MTVPEGFIDGYDKGYAEEFKAGIDYQKAARPARQVPEVRVSWKSYLSNDGDTILAPQVSR